MYSNKDTRNNIEIRSSVKTTKCETRTGVHGITLVALVITVIVLLILASVSMSLITNDGSLFGKAREAGDEYTAKSNDEKNQIDMLMEYLNGSYLNVIPVLDAIEITHEPSNTEYNLGDEFDKTGMTVIARYTNRNTKRYNRKYNIKFRNNRWNNKPSTSKL